VFTTPEEVKLCKEYKLNRDAWFVQNDALRSSSRQAESGLADAQKLYTGASSKAFNAAYAELQELGEVNRKLSDAQWAESVYGAHPRGAVAHFGFLMKAVHL
jgi:hypothetical protein